MEIKKASDEDLEVMHAIAINLRTVIGATCPTEDDFPGIKSLVVTALISVAGELLYGLPEEQKASVVAHYQQFIHDATWQRETTVN